MSVELYPDHKAILYFYDSLRVYEIDFLDYLTGFLSQDEYAERHFDIYVKPTLHYSAFDFMVVEPDHAIYIIQTPESFDQYELKKKALADFYANHLEMLSPSLKKNLKRRKNKRSVPIKQFFYFYDKALLAEFVDKDTENDVFITGADFDNDPKMLDVFFENPQASRMELTPKESSEIYEILNPNTNISNYIPKLLPPAYQEYIESKPQSKQKFKGTSGSGKSVILSKRVINCSNRLKNSGNILVIAGDASKVNHLKDLITAEARKSLQELGVDVSTYQALIQPRQKYNALFIDDAHHFKPAWFDHLLNDFLVEMNEENDYEYVVMSDEENLPKVSQIYGPFVTLKFDLAQRTRLLNQSRQVFLDILKN
jgi:hypothetical protein